MPYYKGMLSGLCVTDDLVEHHIRTPETARPVHQPPYRLPYAYRGRVKNELQEMLAAEIIEPSSSDWSSPMVVVHKEDGSLRLCVDLTGVP